MKQILFPTDFSENANNALAIALKLATDFDAKLHIINTYKMPYSSSSPMQRNLLEALEKSSQEELQKCEDTIRSTPAYKNLNIKTKAMAGDVANAVDVYANKMDIDLVVMGTKGASGLKEVLIGSNAEEVVIHSDKSVLIVPNEVSFLAVKKIGFAIDLKEIEDAAIFNTYVDFVKKYNSETMFVHISKNTDVEEKEKSQMSKFPQSLSDIKFSLHTEVNENIINGVNSFIGKNNCDMLAVLSRKHGFVEKIFHKSITNKLACQAELPIFVVKEI